MFLQNTCTDTSGRSKTRNLFLPIQRDECSLTIRGKLHIYYLLFLQSQVSLQQQKFSKITEWAEHIQDALNPIVSFKYAVSICNIEFIWFSNHCMLSWAELASSSEPEELVNFLQSQRNPKVTSNVGGTLRLLGC